MAYRCCMDMALISILLLASSSMLVPAGSASVESTPAYRFELTHVDADGGFTREELLKRAEDRAELRAAMLSNTDAKYTTSAQYSPYEYLIELEIGTPPQPFKAIADTGSELVWTKKLENCRCNASSTFTRWSCIHPDATIESPDDYKQVPCECKASTAGAAPKKKEESTADCSSSNWPCMFKKTYGSGSTWGFMATEKLTLRSKPINMGCAIDWPDNKLPASADGIVGLNRGKKSLVKQLEVNKFAYCLSNRTDEEAPKSWFLFGDDKLELRAGHMSTKFVEAEDEEKNDVGNTMYHVQLDGISIGGNRMHPLPKESFKRKSKNDGNKGVMFVDSGSPLTFLEKGVFVQLLVLLNKLLAEKDETKTNCFQPAEIRPEMVLYFPGAEMRLPWANYMAETEVGSGLFCLKIREHEKKSVLGNFQQQNMHMLFDLTRQELHFALRKDCSDSDL